MIWDYESVTAQSWNLITLEVQLEMLKQFYPIEFEMEIHDTTQNIMLNNFNIFSIFKIKEYKTNGHYVLIVEDI